MENKKLIQTEQQLEVLNKLKFLAVELSKSSLLPKRFKNPHDAWYAIAVGDVYGFNAVYSLANVNVIDGTPSLSASAIAAVAKSQEGYMGMDVTESTQKRVNRDGYEYDAVIAVKCVVKRELKSGVVEVSEASFSLEDAHLAGLLGKANWRTYPTRMLRARAIRYACTDAFPEALAGTLSTEEVEDMGGSHAPSPKASMQKVAAKMDKQSKPKAEPVPAKDGLIEAEYEVVDEVVDEVAGLPDMVKAFGVLLNEVSLISSDIDTYRERIKHAVKNKDVATIKHVLGKLAKLRDEQKTRASARPSRVDIAHDRVKKIISKQPESEQDELFTKAVHLHNAHATAALDALADELLKRPKPVEGLGFDDALPPAAEGVIDAINQLLAAGYNKVHAANSIRKHFPEIGLANDSTDWQAAILAATVDEEYLKKMEKHYQQAAKGAAKNTNPVKDNDANEIARLAVEIDKIITDDAVEVTPEMERLFTGSTVTSLQALKAMVAAPSAQVKNINKLLKQKGLKLESFAPGYADASLLGAKLANEVEEKLKQADDF